MKSIFRSGAFSMRLISGWTIFRLSPCRRGEDGGEGFSMVAKEGRQPSLYPLP